MPRAAAHIVSLAIIALLDLVVLGLFISPSTASGQVIVGGSWALQVPLAAAVRRINWKRRKREPDPLAEAIRGESAASLALIYAILTFVAVQVAGFVVAIALSIREAILTQACEGGDTAACSMVNDTVVSFPNLIVVALSGQALGLALTFYAGYRLAWRGRNTGILAIVGMVLMLTVLMSLDASIFIAAAYAGDGPDAAKAAAWQIAQGRAMYAGAGLVAALLGWGIARWRLNIPARRLAFAMSRGGRRKAKLGSEVIDRALLIITGHDPETHRIAFEPKSESDAAAPAAAAAGGEAGAATASPADAGPRIRPATRADVMDLVAFVDMAGEGFASYFWSTMAKPGQSPVEVGRARALRDSGAFSWRNAHIAEVDGAPAGALVGYVIADPVDPAGIAKTSELVRPLAELEAQAPGHWYVNVLAVYPEHRGKGIGKALLDHAGRLAAAAAARGMAIVVASENAGAVRLYEKAGYRPLARRPLKPFPGYRRGGDWVLMTRPAIEGERQS